MLLAACYERMGQPDLRLKAARQAASLAPTSLPARLRARQARYSLPESPGEAISVYQARTLPRRKCDLPSQRIQIAMGRLKEAGETLDGLTAELKRTAESLLLRALILAEGPKKGSRDLARKAVEAARDEYPEEPAFWVFLANTSDNLKDGLAILDEAQAEAGNGVDIRLLARANLLVRQKADPAMRPRAGS